MAMIKCPECGGSIKKKDVDFDKGYIRCNQCAVRYAIDNLDEFEYKPPKRRKAPEVLHAQITSDNQTITAIAQSSNSKGLNFLEVGLGIGLIAVFVYITFFSLPTIDEPKWKIFNIIVAALSGLGGLNFFLKGLWHLGGSYIAIFEKHYITLGKRFFGLTFKRQYNADDIKDIRSTRTPSRTNSFRVAAFHFKNGKIFYMSRDTFDAGDKDWDDDELHWFVAELHYYWRQNLGKS